MPHEALAISLISSAFAPELAAAGALECPDQRVGADVKALLRVGHLFSNALELSLKVLEKMESYSGNTWSSATITWRFRSATLSLSSWRRRVSWRSSIAASSPSLLGSTPAAQRLGHEHAVDHVGLHARAALEPAHGIGADGVYDDDGVSLVLQAAERPPRAAARRAATSSSRSAARPSSTPCWPSSIPSSCARSPRATPPTRASTRSSITPR